MLFGVMICFVSSGYLQHRFLEHQDTSIRKW